MDYRVTGLTNVTLGKSAALYIDIVSAVLDDSGKALGSQSQRATTDNVFT